MKRLREWTPAKRTILRGERSCCCIERPEPRSKYFPRERKTILTQHECLQGGKAGKIRGRAASKRASELLLRIGALERSAEIAKQCNAATSGSVVQEGRDN